MRHPRRGFTLIELMIVVVIVALLAAIAIPKFQSTKGKANAAALRSDQHNLASAEEAYFSEYAMYSSSADSLRFTRSPGVVLTIESAARDGWSAIATHPASYPLTCAIYFGDSHALAPASAEGRIGCQ